MPNTEKINFSTETAADQTTTDWESEMANMERLSRERAQRIGAKALASLNFQVKHKEIVESSFNKMREHGQKIPQPAGEKPLNNNERRDYAYLDRLETILSNHDPAFEKRLWNLSAEKVPVVQLEDIPNSFWQNQEQILHDNGQDRILSDAEKLTLTQDYQHRQTESLQSWAKGFAAENCSYPLWFKVYAWEGVTKLGVFDADKNCFAERNETTVAPYPRFNTEALDKTYEAMSEYFAAQGKTEDPDAAQLFKLIQGGKFNELYSQKLLETKVIIKTPEHTKDVHGEWQEYLPGQEEELADAAEGTKWCISSPSMGKYYLDRDDLMDDSGNTTSSNKAKFVLFKLKDPDTNRLSSTACASIRLDANGQVAEISGLLDNQGVEDSLLPIVQEKTLSLPGGKKFLQAFADKQTIKALDQKWQNHEPFTKQEWKFIFDEKRKTRALNNLPDVRLEEFKNPQKALEHGVSATEFAKFLPPENLVENLDLLAQNGADINIKKLVKKLDPDDILHHYDTLTKHGANINVPKLAQKLDPVETADHIDLLLKHGVDINKEQLAAELEENYGSGPFIENLEDFVKNNVPVHIDYLLPNLLTHEIIAHFNTLNSLGANLDINKIAATLNERELVNYRERLEALGYRPPEALS